MIRPGSRLAEGLGSETGEGGLGAIDNATGTGYDGVWGLEGLEGKTNRHRREEVGG